MVSSLTKLLRFL